MMMLLMQNWFLVVGQNRLTLQELVMRLKLQVGCAFAIRVWLIKVERSRQHAIICHVVPSAPI